MTGSNRVIRGGNWNNNLNNSRSANRNNNNPSNRNNNVGFRPASSPPGQKASVHGRPSRASAATRAAVPRPSEGPNSPAAPVAPRRGRGGPFQPFLARYRRFPPACPCNDQQALADHFNLS